MTDYTDVTLTEYQPLAPITAPLMAAAIRNPTAITEGADGAPRNVLKSLERLSAGDQIRSSTSFSRLAGSGSSDADVFAFIQIGVVRVVVTPSSGAVLTSLEILRRRSGGGGTVMGSGPNGFTVDFSVIPGDLIFLRNNNPSADLSIAVEIKTNGGSLWPGSSWSVENNDV